MSKLKLNDEIGQMLCHWLNNFGFKPKINSICEISRTEHIFRLMALTFGIKDTGQFVSQIPHEKRTEAIDTFIADKCQIRSKGAIDTHEMLAGDTWQCAKLALVILYHGISHSIDEFIQAADRLPNSQYPLVEHFYTVLEQHKSINKATDIRVYEAYLSCEDLPKRIRTPSAKNDERDSASILSPMQKASLNSPNRMVTSSNAKRTLPLIDEETQHQEKRRQEIMMREKDAQIEELQEQIGEREIKLKKFENQCEEFTRKLAELKSYKEKADEYDLMVDKVRLLESENSSFEQNLRKLQSERDELREIRAKFDEKQASMNRLSEELEVIAKKERSAQVELKRLKRIENDVQDLVTAKKVKEAEIVKLIEEKAYLQQQISDLNKCLIDTRMSFTEQVDELHGLNACKDTEVNLLNAKLANLQEEFSAKERELNADLTAKEEEIEAMREKILSLEIELRKKEDERHEVEKALRETILKLEMEISEERNEKQCLQSCLSTEKFYAQEEREKHERVRAEFDALKSVNGDLETKLAEIRNRLQAKSEENLHLIELNKEFIEKNGVLEAANSDAQVLVGDLRQLLDDEKKKLENLRNEFEAKFLETTKDHQLALESLKEENLARLNELKLGFESEKGALETEIKLRGELNAQLEARLAQLNTDFEAMKSGFGRVEREKCEADERIAQLSAQLDALRSDVDEKNKDLQTLRDNFGKLEEEKKASEADLNAILAEKEVHFGEINVRLVESEKNLTEALRSRDECLGRLQSCVVEKEEICKALNEKIVQLEHLNILNDKVKEYQTLIESKMQFESHLEAKVALLQEDLELKKRDLEQLHGQLQSCQCALSSQQGENEQLTAEISRITNELASKIDEIARMEAKLAEYENVLSAKEGEFSETSAKLAHLQQELSQKLDVITQLEAKIGECETVIGGKSAESNELSACIAQLTGELKAKCEEISQLEAKSDQLSEQVVDLQSKCVEYESEISRNKLVESEKNAKISQLEGQLCEQNHLASLNGELYKKIEAFEAELSGKEAQCVQIDAQKRQFESELNDAKQEIGKKSEILARYEEAMVEKEAKLREFEAELTLKARKILETDHVLNALQMEYKSKFELKAAELDAKDQLIVNLQNELKNTSEQTLSQLEVLRKEKIELKSLYEKEVNQLVLAKEALEKRLVETVAQIGDEKQTFLKIFTELGNKKNECELLQVQQKQLQLQLNTSDANKVSETEIVQLRKELLETKAKNDALQSDNDKLKEEQKTLESKLESAVTSHNDMKSYAQKLDEHYQKKKAMFAKREDELKEARDELDKLRSVNNEHLIKLTNQGLEYQTQMNDLEDRYKALAKENVSLKTQLDYLERKMRDGEKKTDLGGSSMSLNAQRREYVSSSLGASSGARMAHALMATPKPSSKFMDDSTVKYSSPKTGNEFPEFTQPLDDFSFRRQSIDTITSFRTGAANSTLGGASAVSGLSQQPAALSRFDTISENDIEAGINSEKFLPFEQQHAPERDLNRLSILLTRNQKQKPHLQSSYALETFNYAQPMEKMLRKDREILKSKTNLKRPFDENSADITSIELKKTHLSDASNTINVTQTISRPSGTFKSVKDVLKR